MINHWFQVSPVIKKSWRDLYPGIIAVPPALIFLRLILLSFVDTKRFHFWYHDLDTFPQCCRYLHGFLKRCHSQFYRWLLCRLRLAAFPDMWSRICSPSISHGNNLHVTTSHWTVLWSLPVRFNQSLHHWFNSVVHYRSCR